MRDVYIVQQHSCIEFMVSKGEQELPFYLCFEIGQIAKSEMACIYRMHKHCISSILFRKKFNTLKYSYFFACMVFIRESENGTHVE